MKRIALSVRRPACLLSAALHPPSPSPN